MYTINIMNVEKAHTASGPNYSFADLRKRAIQRRAVEAAIWGMPAVNYYLMYQEMVNKLEGCFNQVLYWSRLLDWKNQTLTPNPDVIYLMPFFNTQDVGPIVMEIPPADDGLFNGSIMNFWQAAIEDVGPGGMDKGKGAKYLFMPPGYSRTEVPVGYMLMPSDTYRGYALLRSVPKSGSDVDVTKAITYSKRVKLYPLSQAADPPSTKFVDASGVLFDSTIRYDPSFFKSQPNGPSRTMVGTRQGDDRPPQDHWYRERGSPQPQHRRHPGGKSLVRR
jgi:hypothetical protein